MIDIVLFVIAIPFLIYIAVWMGVAMLMATMTEFTEYQNQAHRWPAWWIKAFKTLLSDEKVKKSHVIKLFVFHFNEAIFLSMAAMVPSDIDDYISMTYEDRLRVMYLSIQPKRRTK